MGTRGTRWPSSDGRTTWLASVAAGLIIGAVETVLAVAFAALVFGGLLAARLPDGIGLYLGAAVLTLAFLAWRAGPAAWSAACKTPRPPCSALAAAAAAAKAAELAHVARTVRV